MNFLKKLLKDAGVFEIAVAVAALAIGTVFGGRIYVHAREQRWMRTCQENLTRIDGAKEQWALEHNKKVTDTPELSDLISESTGYLKAFPGCPAGGSYVINPVGTNPVCSTGLSGHTMTEVGTTIICGLE